MSVEAAKNVTVPVKPQVVDNKKTENKPAVAVNNNAQVAKKAEKAPVTTAGPAHATPTAQQGKKLYCEG